jgi:hypothetical protein
MFKINCAASRQTLGSLHHKRKGVPAEIKKAKMKKGEHVPIFKDKLMTMKWKDKEDICLVNTTHDGKMVSARVRGKNIMKLKVAADYNSRMGGVNLSDAYPVHYHSIRKRQKKKNTIKSTVTT